MRLALRLVIAAVLAAPARADAYVLEGDPWPESTIRYAVLAPRFSGAVARAARVWNQSGVGVRFVRVTAADADVFIR